MKKIVSVSLGSSQRDHEAEFILSGQKFQVKRLGSNGDFSLAQKLLQKIDGKVDVIGLGGINTSYFLGDRKYAVPQARILTKIVQQTPIVDGSMVKKYIEPLMLKDIRTNMESLKDKVVLLVSALDRYWLGKELENAGAKVLVGDAKFALNIPIIFKSLKQFSLAAAITMPFLSLIPIQLLYPIGSKQDESGKPWNKLYHSADIIAGDFHFIKRHLPEKLKGKVMLTSTVTQKELAILQQRGVKEVYTTTPAWNGQRFGANVLEAVLVALGGEKWFEKDLRLWLDEIGYSPGFERLN